MRRSSILALLLVIPTYVGTVLAADDGKTATAPALPTFAPDYYVDSLHGFALRPPRDTVRVRETSSRRLVAWINRDEKTEAVRWTLEVFVTVHEPTSMPAEEYASLLADELNKAGQFKVESKWVGSAAGKTTMNFRGLWSGQVKLWRVQTWVQASPLENLVLSISGSPSDKPQLETVLKDAVASLKLFDPAQAREARMKSLLNGADALSDLNDVKLGKILSREPAYFLVRAEGKTMGFLKISETPAMREKVQGVLVVRLGALKPPDEPPRLTREELFATPDRMVERWHRISTEDQPPVKIFQEGEKTGTRLRVQTGAEGQAPRLDQQELPTALRNAYLPMAFDVLVPRLIERKPGRAYGFAIYNSAIRNFEMRTILVVGPELVSVGGREIKAVRLNDQMAIDSPPASVWVDDRGTVLKIVGDNGVTLERTDSKTVVSAYSAELLELDKLGFRPRKEKADALK